MTEQLLYNNERQTVDISLTMPRGDDRELIFNHVLGPSSAIKEARFHVVDSDDTVVIALSLDSDAAQWDFSTSNVGTITINSADTVGVSIGNYQYAIELIDQSDLVYTPQRGSFELSDDIVDNAGSAPYLSWSTRDDLNSDITALETDISQMATCGDFSYLTVAIVGGEGSITVANGDLFANAGAANIRVILDSGSYEDDTISSVSGNVITLSGTVAGAAASGNPVRIT
ncbi:hypothetical protein [Kaarinaea lacus]